MSTNKKVYPDAFPMGWDAIAEAVVMEDPDRGLPLELPRGVSGQLGLLIETAWDGGTEEQIAAALGVTIKRVQKILDDTDAIRAAVAAAEVQARFDLGDVVWDPRRGPRRTNKPRTRVEPPNQPAVFGGAA